MSAPDAAGRRPREAPAGDARQARDTASQLRRMLAEVTGRPELLACPDDAALFGTGVGLDSLTGTLLLRQIRDRFGVDVAAEDLNLDSLATLGSLAEFVSSRSPAAGSAR